MWIKSVLGNLLWTCSLIETSDSKLSGIHWPGKVSYLNSGAESRSDVASNARRRAQADTNLGRGFREGQKQTDRPTDRQTDRPTDRQTDRQTKRNRDRQRQRHWREWQILSDSLRWTNVTISITKNNNLIECLTKISICEPKWLKKTCRDTK